MAGRDPVLARPDRRAFVLGLAGGALTAPHWARAETPAGADLDVSDGDAVLAASVDLHDRMTVPVTVNGRGPFPFVVDTGANRTVVSDALAARLGLPSAGALRVRAATAESRTPSVRVADLTVGYNRLTDLQAPVLALDNLGALGMLGIDAVKGQRLVMDFRKKQMVIAKTARVEPDPFAVVVEAKSRYGQLLLVDSEVEDIPLVVIVDTGSENTLGNMAMRNFLASRRRQAAEVIGVTGDQASANLGMLPELHIGKIVVRNQQIAYADLYVFEHLGLHGQPSMLLGMSTLRQCDKVSIDFPAREVRFLVGAPARL